MDSAAAVSRLKNYRPILKWLAVAVLAFGGLGFLGGPPLARWLLLDTLSKQLHRPASVGSISVNPYTLTLTVRDLRIGDGKEGETAGFDELLVDLDIASVFRGGAVIDELKLAGPRVRVVREAPGHYDISDLLDEWLKPSDVPTPLFSVSNIQISAGHIEFVDRPAGRNHVVGDLKLMVPFVSNLPHQTKIFVEPAFFATINGDPVELAGRSMLFSESRESELTLETDRFDLGRYAAYLPSSLPAVLQGAKLDADLRFNFRQDAKQAPMLTVFGRVALHDLRLVDRAQQPLLEVKKLEVPVSAIDPFSNRYVLGSLGIDGLDVSVRVDQHGQLNWLPKGTPLRSDKGSADIGAAAKGGAAGQAIEWAIDGLRLNQGNIHWFDDSATPGVQAHIREIGVAAGNLNGQFSAPLTVDASWTLDAAPVAEAGRFALKGVRIDLKEHRVAADDVAVNGLRLAVVREADGRFGALRGPVLRGSAPAADKAAADGVPWQVELRRAALADASLRFTDRSRSSNASQLVEIDELTVEGFSTAAKAAADIGLKARINRKGQFLAKGSVQAKPLSARLRLDMRGIELLPIQPYFRDLVNLTVTRGQLSGQGEVSISAADSGLGGGYKGQVTVGNFHSVDADSEDFLDWKSFHLGKIDLTLAPFALRIGEVALTDFYAHLIVSPEGKLNLLQIAKRDTPAEASAAPAEPPPAQAAPPVAPAAPPAPPPPIQIDKVTLQGGSVSIEDHFIKPNYSAKLAEIGGRVTGLSSTADSSADIDLRGAYDGAPVTIAGKLNPLAAVPSLDIKAEVRGVELTPFSPYSGKYAGYAIDKGKLSMFLGYQIDQGKLRADNRLFLDQLTFGQKVESPDATKLPVTLAVALLKNRRGEIDINLPISGSLDDPEFSVGGIVVQVIVNLLSKAITAPFALIGSLFGGGEELSNVVFADGRSSLSPEALKRLAGLAKALDDRPALKLEIAGRVDPDKDREGLRRAALDRKVKAQKLARMVKEGQETGNLDEIKVADAEYLDLLEQAYKQEKFPKPRNWIGMTKSLPRDEMEKLILANVPAGDQELRDLADERAKAVADWLSGQGKVPRERIFLLPAKLNAEAAGKETAQARADFSLK